MQKKHSLNTIVAPATPPGRGGISIVRISGPHAAHIITQITQQPLPPIRQAAYRSFFDADGHIIDLGLVLFFQSPDSFTGEDVAEFHTHGSPVVVDYLVQQILQYDTRLARPGEFSERAFLNDKIDLAQAEAIADLIDSASLQAARSAIRSLQGEFSKRIHGLVTRLIELRMYVEAAIDFPEEEIDFLADGIVDAKLNAIIMDLQHVQNTATMGAKLREGLTVVIAGKPNAGKSSLLNQLSGRETAIVTDIAGTTRDLIREHILLQGVPLHIIDTAGLRDSSDPVEQEGIRRARNEINHADVILLIVDATENFTDIESLLTQYHLPHQQLIVVVNKIDLIPTPPQIINTAPFPQIYVSAKTGDGIDLLRQHLIQQVGILPQQEDQFIARRRHLDALARTLALLLQSQAKFQQHTLGELLAEDLRLAQQYLNEITGEFNSDDLLGKIFASFCIGK